MEEPLIESGPRSYPSTSTSGATDTFSRLSIRATNFSSGDVGTTPSLTPEARAKGENLESIDYLPANNAPWRKYITNQERMRSSW